jgi:hypothetical protein
MVMVSWQCRRGGGARWRGGEGGVQVGADAVGTFRGGGGGHQHLQRVSDEGRTASQGGAVLAGALAVEGRDGVLLWRAFSHPGYITNTSGDQPLMQVR